MFKRSAHLNTLDALAMGTFNRNFSYTPPENKLLHETVNNPRLTEKLQRSTLAIINRLHRKVDNGVSFHKLIKHLDETLDLLHRAFITHESTKPLMSLFHGNPLKNPQAHDTTFFETSIKNLLLVLNKLHTLTKEKKGTPKKTQKACKETLAHHKKRFKELLPQIKSYQAKV